MQPQSFTDQLKARQAEFLQRAEALQRQLAEITETVTSPDRMVTVTVGAGGVLQQIVVEPAGQRATPGRWSKAVMRAYAQGCRAVGERAAELMQQHNPQSPVAAMMREAIPPEPTDEEDGR